MTGKHTHLLGIDTGGTFTDFVCLEGGAMRVHKVLSTPDAPERAILQGLDDLGLMRLAKSGALRITHGTTVATNATLEGKGVRTAYITNKGMRDVLTIGRQTREKLYDLKVSKRTVDVPQELLFEIDVRMGPDGEIVKDLTDDALAALKQAVTNAAPEAIAINLLFSFVDDRHERAIEAAFSDAVFTSRSSSVLPEYREYERGVATWVNAWIGPLIRTYLNSLREALDPCPIAIMQSSGLTIDAGQAANKAVNLLLSGPVGGIEAALLIGRLRERDKLMTFDMGGTSTDVSLLEGAIRLTRQSQVAGLPIAIPMADIHTIGAGGGSIAYVDEGSLLQVGPESAGANPGPACYGQGGTRPTVTDANLLLGRLRQDAFLRGQMRLDIEAARTALAPLAEQLGMTIIEAAQGIVDIANEHMAQALRVISVERGHDPREYTLVCFGGAGGLHVCALADALGVSEVIVPIHCGVLSALGMLATKPGREVTRTHSRLLADAGDLPTLFAQMEAEGKRELAAEGASNPVGHWSVDLRYLGQSEPINLPFAQGENLAARFAEAHQARYGHQLEREVELVNLRVHLEAEGGDVTLPPWQATGERPEQDEGWIPKTAMETGEVLRGPLLITEDHATTHVASGWQAMLDETGNLLLSRV